MADFIRITRGRRYYEISVKSLKRMSLTKCKKHFHMMPEDLVEKAFYEVNGKLKKKTKTQEPEKEDKG